MMKQKEKENKEGKHHVQTKKNKIMHQRNALKTTQNPRKYVLKTKKWGPNKIPQNNAPETQ